MGTKLEENEAGSTTFDNDYHIMDITGTTNSTEDSANGDADEDGVDQGDAPQLTSRSNRHRLQSSLRKRSRTRPEIDYTSLSGVREYNDADIENT